MLAVGCFDGQAQPCPYPANDARPPRPGCAPHNRPRSMPRRCDSFAPKRGSSSQYSPDTPARCATRPLKTQLITPAQRATSRDAALPRKVRSVALSPDGDSLVSGGSDNFAQAAALPGIPRRSPGTPPERLHPLDHDVAANAKPQRMPSGTHAPRGRCGTLRVSQRRPCGASCCRRAARQAQAGSMGSGGRPRCSGRARRCRACAFRQLAARQRPPAACRDPCSAPRDGGSGS